MKRVKVTDFRARLPEYLSRVQAGETITLLSRGRPIARVVPAAGASQTARRRLTALRRVARIGDVVSPVEAVWSAEHGHP